MTTARVEIPEAFSDLFTPSRYKVYYGGRGGAKSWAFAQALLNIGFTKQIRVLCAREFQTSIKDSVHKLLSDTISRYPHLANHYEVQATVIKGKNGTEFSFKGLKHNSNEIKSFEGVDYVWVEEAQAVSHTSWEVLIPTVRKENSEIWICFNPKNPTDPTYKRFVSLPPKNSIVKKVSWRDNPFFPKVLNDERLDLMSKDPDAYDHIWEGGLDQRRIGVVYGRQIEKMRTENRITKVPYDPAYPVFTAWDLGYADSTAIWFAQFVGRSLHLIDYVEDTGKQITEYVKLLKSKPYNYSRHYLPHDGRSNTIQGQSAERQLQSAGLYNVRCLDRTSDIEADINNMRGVLDYSWIDQDACKDGLHALENYHYQYDDDRQTFKSTPYHDWTSHGADAARYLCLAAGLEKNMTGTKPKVSFSMTPGMASL